MYGSDIEKLFIKFLLKVKSPRKISSIKMKKRRKGNEEETEDAADKIRKARMTELQD